MPNITEVTVRYAETDCMGVVHHAVYPVWFEIARTDYIKAAGMSYAEMEKRGVMLPVTGISCRYRLPARYDDTLLISEDCAAYPREDRIRLYSHTKGRDRGAVNGNELSRVRGRKDVSPAEFQKGNARVLRANGKTGGAGQKQVIL